MEGEVVDGGGSDVRSKEEIELRGSTLPSPT